MVKPMAGMELGLKKKQKKKLITGSLSKNLAWGPY